jgi:glycosyltransferase involved in cell wall biosynthesis
MTRAKKILFVITKATWGGAQRYVYDMAQGAQAAGYEVVVAYGEPGLMATKLADAGIRTIRIGAMARDIKGASDWRALKELRNVIRSERPDVVHVNSSKAAGLGALAARLERVPRIIYTAHGWAFNESRPWWQKLILRMAAEATIYLAHETICVSKAIKRDITPIAFANHKLVIIHNGIECAPLLTGTEARAALLPGHEDKKWIGMVSELHPTKRVVDAIDAFALLEKNYPETILVVLGEGEERQMLEDRIAKHGLADRVYLLGFVANGSQYLNAFDIFLHTSQSEALAYAVLEAGCARLPVVATKVGGIPEIIENGVSGLLVPAHSPASVASALEELLKNPERAEQLGAHLHAKVIRDFSQVEMIKKTLARYER